MKINQTLLWIVIVIAFVVMSVDDADAQLHMQSSTGKNKIVELAYFKAKPDQHNTKFESFLLCIDNVKVLITGYDYGSEGGIIQTILPGPCDPTKTKNKVVPATVPSIVTPKETTTKEKEW
jgi:hypothetical protein